MKPQKFSKGYRGSCRGVLSRVHLPKQEGEKRGRKIVGKELARVGHKPTVGLYGYRTRESGHGDAAPTLQVRGAGCPDITLTGC